MIRDCALVLLACCAWSETPAWAQTSPGEEILFADSIVSLDLAARTSATTAQ